MEMEMRDSELRKVGNPEMGMRMEMEMEIKKKISYSQRHT